jgi:transposase InsO family protein
MAGPHRCKDVVHRTWFSLGNGYCESFNSKLRDEFLNPEIFYSMKELRVLAERWRVHYNTVRPHSSLGYRPPAPEAWLISTPMLPYPASI